MKKTFIWLLASLLFTMVGCVEGLHESGMTETSSEQLPDLTAGFAEGETRTYVESGKYLRWHEDDRLTAFYGNTLNRQYKFNGATGDNSGSFSYVSSGNLETGNALDRIYAVYPYDETATITDDGQISLTLPAVQTYAENSFGRGANTMLAVTENLEDTFLCFKNVCGYLKLKLYNAEGTTIKSIEVQGNGEEKIAGAASATIAFGEAPQLTMSDNATTTITLDCGDGVALGATAEAATEFWVVIPETIFKGGITITVTDTEGGIFEKSTTKEVVIERNAVQPMAALEVEFVVPVANPANNEIWYTNGSTTEATTPNRTVVFGANIVSNTYDAEKECWVIKFEGDVTSIGDSAFSNCRNLTSVTIPDSVTSIGYNAFNYCWNLTSVIIPDSVTEIGYRAFYNCRNLTSVIIGNSVTSIGYDAFHSCISLQEFKGKFASEDGRCLIIDGVLNSFAPAELTEYTIPDSVTTIGNYAFYGCTSLTSVTIPDSVTEIRDFAFNDCSSLTSVTISDSVTKIGYGAFDNCSSLNNVIIGNGVRSIGDFAFSGCSSITSVHISDITDWCNISFERYDANPLYNGASLYLNNELVTNLIIPNSVTIIKDYAFESCLSLTSVTIPDSVTSIGRSAFSGCENLTSVTIPNSVTRIDGSAFSYCTSLESITIPNSVTTIGSSAFSHCTSLEGITIPDSVTMIETSTFYGCENLTSITIPNSLTTIEVYAFRNCSSLTSVTIPDSVTEIKDRAFINCSSLESVYCKATTPPSLESPYVFNNNASGRKIYVPMESVSEYKSASYWADYAYAIVGYDF